MKSIARSAWLSFVGLAAVTFSATYAHAHETWLLPSTFTPAPNAKISFTISSGMDFPHDETAIAPERLERRGLRLHAGETFEHADVQIGERGEHALNLHAQVGPAGVAQAYVALHPREIDLDAGQIEHYFEEIGASKEIRDTWDRVKASTTWSETYTKYAKCVLLVGGDTASSDASHEPWTKPLELAFELVLLDDPREVKAGKDVRFRLLRDGKPAVGQPVGRSVEGRGTRRFETTDENGEVTFPMSRSGRVLVFSTDLRFVDEDSKWVSRFTTLTLHVAPRNRSADR